MRKAALLILATALALPSLAEAEDKPPISLAKTSKWEINYDKDSCHLLANFGEGDQRVIMRLTRFEPSDQFDLALYGKPVDVNNKPRLDVRLTLGTRPPVKWVGYVGSSGKDLPMLMLSSLRLDGWQYPERPRAPLVVPAISPDDETKVDSFTLKLPFRNTLKFETGSLGAPLRAMRKCTADLVEHWGYDAAVQASLRKPPEPLTSPGTWFVSSDYPPGAVMQGHNGMVQFRLDVDETGVVTGCSILHRTSPDEFADLSCKLLRKRAKFSPALDAKGKPVRSFFVKKVNWISAL